MQFTIVDVFAESPYSGNQLAVFYGNPGAELMLKLANEMNYSETTFITSDKPENGGYSVRIFTRSTELPFAGHPTLGTAFTIRQLWLGGQASEVRLNLQAGQIAVTFHPDGVAWMRQKPPQFGPTYDTAAIADALGLYIDDFSGRFPIQQVSTGIPWIIAPLKSLQAVQEAKLKGEAFINLIGDAWTRDNLHGILIFAPETIHADNQLHARVLLVDKYGTHEDAATGSANGCLAGYLVKHRYNESDTVRMRVEQGYQIGRPSLILLDATEKSESIEVNVGGRVRLVARGELIE